MERGSQAVPASTAKLSSLVLDLGPFGFQGQVLQEKRKHHSWGWSDKETRLQQNAHVNDLVESSTWSRPSEEMLCPSENGIKKSK
jgi:hypothetical protein